MDVSSYALGAVLIQSEVDEEHPVDHAGELLTKTQQNYATVEREPLAVVWTMNKFIGSVEGYPNITLSTDHQPLHWLQSLKSPTEQLARWAKVPVWKKKCHR